MTYKSIDTYNGRNINISGTNIVEAVEGNWAEAILPHVKGNAAGCSVVSAELLPYAANTTRGYKHFITLRVVAKGQRLAHREAGDAEYVSEFDFVGEFPGFAGHKFDLQ